MSVGCAVAGGGDGDGGHRRTCCGWVVSSNEPAAVQAVRKEVPVSDPENCATCGVPMPPRGPMSPQVRRCQDHWWEEQHRLFAAGEPVSPLALPVLQSRAARTARAA
jgi:hypothetical protein